MNYIEIDMRTNLTDKKEDDDPDEPQNQKKPPFPAHEDSSVDNDTYPELHIIPPAKEKDTPPPSTPDKFPDLPGVPQQKNTDNSPEIN